MHCGGRHQGLPALIWREVYVYNRARICFLVNTRGKMGCYSLAVAGNKRATWLLCQPSPCWRGEENGKKKAKTGWSDNGSLTEQQTKGTATTTIQISRTHKTNSRMHRVALTAHCCALPSCDCLPAAQLPPTRNQHDGTWYGIPCSGQVGSARTAVFPPGFWWKINPVLAEPRTVSEHWYCTGRMTTVFIPTYALTWPCVLLGS